MCDTGCSCLKPDIVLAQLKSLEARLSVYIHPTDLHELYGVLEDVRLMLAGIEKGKVVKVEKKDPVYSITPVIDGDMENHIFELESNVTLSEMYIVTKDSYPIGEIGMYMWNGYPCWISIHYTSDVGYDGLGSMDEAIKEIIDAE